MVTGGSSPLRNSVETLWLVVFRPGALGDTILTVDALAALRARWPSAAIELVGNPAGGALLQDAGLVERVTTWDGPEVTGLYVPNGDVPRRWSIANAAVLWLPTAEPVQSALRRAGARRVIGAHPLAPVGMHTADHLVRTLAPLGVQPAADFPLLVRPEPSPIGDTAGEHTLAIVHPGSGAVAKNWPADRFAALVEWLASNEWEVRLLRGPADGEAVAAVTRLLGSGAPAVVEPATTRELAAALAGAALYIGNDSGVSHVSARLGVPSVVIFGSTDPRQWAPRGPRVVACAGDPWPTEVMIRDSVLRVLGSGS
jgi:heptosyltransferase III